jgi:hypothetical protein
MSMPSDKRRQKSTESKTWQFLVGLAAHRIISLSRHELIGVGVVHF